jgi:molecular chaperone DnaK (HSP70)
LSVNLYEKKSDENNSIKVISSLLESSLTSEALFELNKKVLKSKLPLDYHDLLDHDKSTVLLYCEELDAQFKSGREIAKLKISKDPLIEIEVTLDEIKKLYQPYVNSSAELLDAILNEQNLNIKKDIEQIDFCLKSFTSVTEFLMNERFKQNGIEKKLIHGTKDVETLPGTIELASNIMTKGDNLINTLNCNLGINVFGGLFLKKIARGTELPCPPCVTNLTTMVDNQESCVIKIVQGERPFSRYCHELGTLTVPNLPLEKAGNVQIEVTLCIDRDEILTVKAYEPKTDQNLEVQIDRSSSSVKEDEINLVLDAIKYKKQDEEKRVQINKVTELLKEVRAKYTDTELEDVALKEVNRFVNWFNAQESFIDEVDMDECIKCVEDFVEKLEKREKLVDKLIFWLT